MLSFGYTLLNNRIVAAIQQGGLNPRLSFFHSNIRNAFALASDLIEPLRHIVERIVIALIHLGQIKHNYFYEKKVNNRKMYLLTHKGMTTFIERYENTMATTFKYKGNGKVISYNNYIDTMINELIVSMRYRVPIKALRIY
jgi:CRISPR-associated endonuclease Cas1